MKHISILAPEGAVLGSVEGPRQVFSEVNKYLTRIGQAPVFNPQLIGVSKEVRVAGGRYSIYADALISDVKKTDLIIIPAVDGDMQKVLERNKDYLPWIIDQYKRGAEVASLCIGAFILASTGLVTGRSCATHWLAANEFRKMFPDVNLVEDRIITDEQGIYSSGGAFSYLNLILYLIEKHVGRSVAIFMSKAFQIEIERRSQSPFHIFQGQKDHDDNDILKAQEFIEQNFPEKITVDQLASMLAIGRRNLERRFKKATGNTVIEYIQRVKIEAAKKSFESTRKNINEVMFDVGYSDVKAFRTVFKRLTNLSPIEYKNKYNSEALVA